MMVIKEKYSITEILIGKGSYATVKLGYLNSSLPSTNEVADNVKKVAIKIYNKSQLKK
jgi:hypothetical protein